MQYLFILLLNFILSETVGGSGIVSIFLSQYKNPGGQGDNGNCCDGIKFICRGYCDHYFIVCLDQPSGSPTNVRQCSIGRYTTGVVDNRNEIRFSNSIGGKPNPTELPFDKWPGGALLKVEVWDNDDNNDDFVELLSTGINMVASRSRAESREDSFQAKKRTQLDLFVSVFCDEKWYGPRCDVFCEPSSGEKGYYECDANGGKLCHPGWRGEDCKENIDECISGPCSSPGGHCVDEINGFVCVCQPGFTGSSCETEIDECVSNPCYNNATCRDLAGRFQCLCPIGYTGHHCESEISYCSSSPCGDGATCQEVVGNFRCLCPINATGSQCEINLDNCGDNYCHNNGTCMTDSSNSTYCRCYDGWEGPDCIDNIDDCEGIVCRINMTCIDLVAGYECVCNGENCDGPALWCTSDTCTNGGTCLDGEDGYACICPNGFVGHHCHVAVANVTCIEHPCLNNGTCVALNGSASCHCPFSYSGRLCENYDDVTTASLVDPCLSSPCYGQATCLTTSHGWECVCPEELSGVMCDTPTANMTNKIMVDSRISRRYLTFYGLASDKDIREVRRHLNDMVGSKAVVYATVEYCTSHLNGDTLGLLIYKVAHEGKAVNDDVLEMLNTKLQKNKLSTTLKVTFEDSCDDSAAESEKTVGAWLGRNWWAVLIVVVIALVVVCAMMFGIYRRLRHRTWQPSNEKVSYTRDRNFSENAPEGVLSQTEALEILNSDTSYTNVLYEGEENVYDTLN